MTSTCFGHLHVLKLVHLLYLYIWCTVTLISNKNMFSSVVYQNAASGAPCSVGADEQAESWLIAVWRQTAKDVNKSKAPLNEVRWIECLVIIVLYQLYEFSRNSFPLYAESLEALFYFLFNYKDFSPHNNKLNSNARHCLSYVCDVSNKLLIIFLERIYFYVDWNLRN